MSEAFPIKATPDLSKRVVPGEGPDDAIAMIIGEAPGEQEDKEGRPFIGKAGQLLRSTLEAHGLSPDQVYITNIVKSRPPGNRTPTQEEIEAHIGYLIAEYKRIKPTHVLLLGNTALHTMTNLPDGIMKSRGYIQPEHSAIQANTYATLHPSAALRSSSNREQFEKDIQVFAKIVKSAYTAQAKGDQ